MPVTLLAGVYKHYKGPLYQAFMIAHDANYDGRNVVVYQALQLDAAHTGYRPAVRTVEDFFQIVCGLEACPLFGEPFQPDAFGGCIRCKELGVPRFAYLGPTWEGDSGAN